MERFDIGDINSISNFAEDTGGEIGEMEEGHTQQNITIRYNGRYSGFVQFWANGNLTDLRGGEDECESWEINDWGRLILN